MARNHIILLEMAPYPTSYNNNKPYWQYWTGLTGGNVYPLLDPNDPNSTYDDMPEIISSAVIDAIENIYEPF